MIRDIVKPGYTLKRLVILLLSLMFMGAVAFIDYNIGYGVALSIFYLIPICACCWYLGRKPALVLSVLGIILLYTSDYLAGHPYAHPAIPIWNCSVRFVFFVVITMLLGQLKKTIEDRERAYQELQKAFEDVKAIHGIIPVCHACRKIRNDKGYWDNLETFVRNQSDAEFTSSICPECVSRHAGEKSPSGGVKS